jgi:hypothetical protein
MTASLKAIGIVDGIMRKVYPNRNQLFIEANPDRNKW